jgi:hypothetical protein
MTEKKAAIIIEIDEEIRLPEAPARFEAFCPQCRRLVKMASTPLAALERGISERQLFRLIEEREIHFVEADRVLVCLDSLKKDE